MPNTASNSKALRSPCFRPKLVIEELIGPSIISNHLLKKYAGKTDNEGRHRCYTPADIRRVKLAIYGIEDRPSAQRPPIINVRMAKGGTGKSTVASNLASAFAFMGYKVLVIDGDPQGSLSGMMGVDPAMEDLRHIGQVMQDAERSHGRTDIASAVHSIYPDGMLDLIPADITLTQIEAWLFTLIGGRDTVFSRLVDVHLDFFTRYDVIIIDGAPGTSLLTFNFMAACQTILAVVWLDRESLKAVNLLGSNLQELKHIYPGRRFDIEIVANGYHPSYRHCQETLATLSKRYPGTINENVIPYATAFTRRQAMIAEDCKGPLVEQDPTSPGGRAIIELARSLRARYRVKLAGLDESVTTVPLPQTEGEIA